MIRKDQIDREKKARSIIQKTIAAVLKLGYHINIPSTGSVSPKTGHTITRVEQVELVPIPDELKRRLEIEILNTRGK